jgi:CBS domain-containing protein
LTRTKKVGEIVRPPMDGIPIGPVVGMTDSVMRAVELMLKNDLTAIAVSAGGRLIGHIRLEDALKHLGLRFTTPLPSNEHGPQAR